MCSFVCFSCSQPETLGVAWSGTVSLQTMDYIDTDSRSSADHTQAARGSADAAAATRLFELELDGLLLEAAQIFNVFCRFHQVVMSRNLPEFSP